ncbi:MAG: chemotaxis protein CheA [Desulfobacterota bacterium]|jgi:two-component system chemotaxis sensor kinase CheA|nr:chemotaxis protein CheA [Thermodesulfobacteriota bacterium]
MIVSNAQLTESLNQLALQTVLIDPEDLMSLGAILEQIEKIGSLCRDADRAAAAALGGGLQGLVEKIILNEIGDAVRAVSLLSEGVKALQNLIERGCAAADDSGAEAFWKDLADLTGIKPPALGKAALGIPEHRETPQEAASGDPPGEASCSLAQDQDLLRDFISEGLEHLDTIEVNLINLEQAPGDQETINAIFRPFHTLKGVSGFLNLQDIHRFSHAVESLLDDARNEKLSIDQDIIDFILEAVDLLKKMVLEVRTRMESGRPGTGTWDLTAYLQQIERLRQPPAEGEGLRLEEQTNAPSLGEILTSKGLIAPEDIQEALKIQAQQQSGKKLGEILVAEEKVRPRQVIEALRDQRKISGEFSESTVKVDTQKLDNLVDLVGELVIAQSLVQQNPIVTHLNDPKLSRDFGQLKRITTDLQKIAMSLRMIPIRQTFQKMIRLVRDLARKTDKLVELQMHGEETEIDRNMVEALYDPLVHMIRNAVDHGLEVPAGRQAAGKAETGRLVLQAYQKGGNIVIEIEDDGQGLNREKIVRKARERGLITADTPLTPFMIDNLIFEPGFSTADRVTDVSGRGVGMDVVKRAIERLKGKVDVFSEEGQGCRFAIRVPLTLAIMDGIIVRIGPERYIIPTVSIKETFRPRPADVSTVQTRGEVVQVRRMLLPLVRLYDLLGVAPQRREPWEALVVVVENEGQQRCLMVDDLVGKQEVVIKNLGEKFKAVKGLAGGAIMGDGRVGLILDINGIFELHQN